MIDLSQIEQQAAAAAMQQQAHKLRVDMFIADTASRIYATLVCDLLKEKTGNVSPDELNNIASIATASAPSLAAVIGMITIKEPDNESQP